MAMIFKDSNGKLFKSASGQYLTSSTATTVTLVVGNNTVQLPNGSNLLVNYSTSNGGPCLSFSADFDLIVCSEDSRGAQYQWGTYQIYSDPLTNLRHIFIYDHNNYENGSLLESGVTAAQATAMQYRPIALLYFNTTTKVLTII